MFQTVRYIPTLTFLLVDTKQNTKVQETLKRTLGASFYHRGLFCHVGELKPIHPAKFYQNQMKIYIVINNSLCGGITYVG